MKIAGNKLGNLLGRSRPLQPEPAPLDDRPTTPFELWVLYELQGLRQDLDDIKKRVDWLTLAIVGASLTFILETIFT